MAQHKDDSLPVCIDFAAFGQVMAKRDKRIEGMINRVRLTQACYADIKGACASIVALDQWMESETSSFTEEQSLTIQSALLTKAVVLYARATHGSADKGGRGSIQIKANLPDRLKADHELIIKLRNEAIVHSHLGKSIGDRVWEEQQLLLVDTGSGYRPMHTMRTTQIDYNAIASMHNLLSFALDFYHQRFSELSDKLVERIHAAGFSLDELLEHSIDPRSYFSNDATFKAALANMPK